MWQPNQKHEDDGYDDPTKNTRMMGMRTRPETQK